MSKVKKDKIKKNKHKLLLEFEEYRQWFERNLIFCQDTHSFVHRLFDKFREIDFDKFEKTYGRAYILAQSMALDIKQEMKEEHDKSK